MAGKNKSNEAETANSNDLSNQKACSVEKLDF